jgi:aminomethyltransferase
MILNDDGGIIDDLIVWWRDDEDFWLMPNAANHERVMASFAEEPACEVRDLQTDTVFLAVQGPGATRLIEGVVGVKPGRFRNDRVESNHGIVDMAGTGYTGDPGAEMCLDAAIGEALMSAFVEAGAVPCGLGARDTLRLEAGLTLWGADIDETTTPLEAGLDFAISFDHEFSGRRRLITQRDHGVERRLAGFVLEDRGIPRPGYQVRTADGGAGAVTSGNLSPILDTGVGLAYLSPPGEVGDIIEVRIRERWVSGRVVEPPFHKSI